MKPVIKKGRRFRGLEVAQAALLLVLGVVVAMALYFVMMEMMLMAPVPDVQLNPYYSYVYPSGDGAVVALRFGKPARLGDVSLLNSRFEWLTTCTGPLMVEPGRNYFYYCQVGVGVLTNWIYVRVRIFGGKELFLPWYIGQ
jgi:hypothetical protein